jgi:hypothetical protein
VTPLSPADKGNAELYIAPPAPPPPAVPDPPEPPPATTSISPVVFPDVTLNVPGLVNVCILNPPAFDSVPPSAWNFPTNAQSVPLYISITPSVVLNLTSPATGLAGRCPVVPTGSLKNPVSFMFVFFNIAILLLPFQIFNFLL